MIRVKWGLRYAYFPNYTVPLLDKVRVGVRVRVRVSVKDDNDNDESNTNPNPNPNPNPLLDYTVTPLDKMTRVTTSTVELGGEAASVVLDQSG
jgi:hypothetical protein